MKESKSVFLDYLGDKISELNINGQKVDQIYDGNRVFLEAKYLKAGQNIVTMNILNKYRTDG